MPRFARVRLEISVDDGSSVSAVVAEEAVFSVAAALPKEERVSLTGSAFTALSPPTGAKGVFIEVGVNPSLTIKGVTGDSGVAATPSSNVWDGWAFLPLGATPSIGIANAGATCVCRAVWI